MTPELQFQLQAICGEFLGTTFYMFFYCVTQYANVDEFDTRSRLECAIATFFLSSAMSFGIGYLSGAHLNPMVTLSVLLLGHIHPLNALFYVGAHFTGSLLGLGMSIVVVHQKLYSLYNQEQCGFCYPYMNPNVPVLGAFAMEFIGTFVFILCVCGTSDKRMYKFRPTNALRFATVNGLITYVLAPFTGPALNPFRALIPGIFHNCFNNLWVYSMAPICGSVTATLLYKYALRYPPPKLENLGGQRIGPSIHVTGLIIQGEETQSADPVEAPVLIGTL